MRRVPRVCVLVSVVVLVLGSCTGSDVEVATTTATTVASSTTGTSPATTITSTGTLLWAPCGSAECATLTVPLDHEDPSQGTVDLAVARRSAQQPEERIGVLFYNPGGPGVPGTPIIIDWSWAQFSPTLLDRFDVVTWDPRGVSEAAKVDCASNPNELLLRETPKTAEQEALIDVAISEYVAGCIDRSGDLLPHLSTVSTARDMDLLRAALGEEQISYLGVSYGTALGSTYATLFPERVRAMVLDAAFDLSAPLADWTVPRVEAQERALTLALEQCAANPYCRFHNDGDPFTAFDDLMARLDAEPLIVDDTEVGARHAYWAVNQGLMREEHGALPDWSALMYALSSAQDGNGRPLRDLALSIPYTIESNLGILCLDWPRRAWEPSQTTIDTVLTVAPRLGPFRLALITPDVCSVWPVEPNPPPPLTGSGAGPLLVVGATGDTATPLETSRDLATHLEHAALLIVEANDHGAYRTHPEALCVLETVDRYLTDLDLPANESRCTPGDPQPHPPS